MVYYLSQLCQVQPICPYNLGWNTNLSQNDSLIKMKIDELRCIASLTELAKRFDCKKFVCCDIITVIIQIEDSLEQKSTTATKMNKFDQIL